MRAHVFQHVAFEGRGSIERWLQERRARVGHTRFYESATLPAVDDIDLLIVMGGPMSANDERTLPWLTEEKRFIRRAIEAGKAVVGICLGAQLIASALGARVYPGSEKEVGWFPVRAVPAGDAGARFPFPAEALVFHWHGETFDLPAGAIHLARSPACDNQAFQIGARVIGLQFHLETTPDSARALVENLRDDLAPARYVQSGEAILSATPATYAAINALMASVMSFVTRAPAAAKASG